MPDIQITDAMVEGMARTGVEPGTWGLMGLGAALLAAGVALTLKRARHES